MKATTEERSTALKKLSDTFKAEEILWKQKNRVCWLREKDRNSNFFHALTKQRRTKNKSTSLMDDSGNMIDLISEDLTTPII